MYVENYNFELLIYNIYGRIKHYELDSGFTTLLPAIRQLNCMNYNPNMATVCFVISYVKKKNQNLIVVSLLYMYIVI